MLGTRGMVVIQAEFVGAVVADALQTNRPFGSIHLGVIEYLLTTFTDVVDFHHAPAPLDFLNIFPKGAG